MKPRLYLPLLFVVPCALVAAAPRHDVEAIIREGNARFQHGDYAGAIARYEKAETISTDPGQVAFNLAVAHYCLAQGNAEGRTGALREADSLFRCCLDVKDPRQAQALYGLGLCLLDKPASALDFETALDCFERCLRAGASAELHSAARQGRELARLRLIQAQAERSRDSEENPNDDPRRETKPDRKPQKGQSGEGAQEGVSKGGNKTETVRVKPEPGTTPQTTEERPPPGSGTLPPVPDRADLPPLSPQDAAMHLEQASQRILDEERWHRRARARPAPPGVRNW